MSIKTPLHYHRPRGATGARSEDDLSPRDIIIVGLDTDDGPDHPLYTSRILTYLDEMLVENIRVCGVMVRVDVIKDGEKYYCLSGQFRIRAARSLELGTIPVHIYTK